MGMRRLNKQLRTGVSAHEKEIRSIQNKLTKVKDLKARNRLIIKLNTHLRLAGKNLRYKKDSEPTQEEKNLLEYNKKYD